MVNRKNDFEVALCQASCYTKPGILSWVPLILKCTKCILEHEGSPVAVLCLHGTALELAGWTLPRKNGSDSGRSNKTSWLSELHMKNFMWLHTCDRSHKSGSGELQLQLSWELLVALQNSHWRMGLSRGCHIQSDPSVSPSLASGGWFLIYGNSWPCPGQQIMEPPFKGCPCPLWMSLPPLVEWFPCGDIVGNSVVAFINK